MKKTNTDAPFFLLMGKIGDLVFANVLWLVCCIPVVTAGASTPGGVDRGEKPPQGRGV